MTMLKQTIATIHGRCRKNILGTTGWLLVLILGAWAAPRIYHRLISSVPAVQRHDWNQTLAAKQKELANPWQDSRPLVILAGDSQIELGDWYDLLAGRWAVRNCGLSRARIADVTALVSAITDSHPRTLVLMCGINNLTAHVPEDACIRDYEALLTTARSHLQPASIIILAVMPLRETAVDRTSHAFNMMVGHFNTLLQQCCQRQQVFFVNANPALADPDGGLAARFTFDGMHLNPEGYRQLSKVLAGYLPQP